MKAYKMCPLALAVALTACGGGSSSGGSSTPLPANTETGIFTDSAVVGIKYQTEPGGKSGETSPLGEYDYVEGDTVTFRIGGVALPAVTASGRVTPNDMADSTQPDQVTNILRLLQSLDEDGNPDNGITISEVTHTALENAAVSVQQAAADFETQYESEIKPQTETDLVSEEQAVSHFADSQQADLRGSWIFVEPSESSSGKGPNGEEINVLTFLDGGRYIVAHKYGNDDQTAASAEWGTYVWDPASGAITFTVEGESDGGGGLSDGPDTVRLEGDALYLGSAEDDDVAFQAVKSANLSYVGAWHLQEEDAFNVLTILDDNHYVVAHNNNAEVYTGNTTLVPVSSEWGTYSIAAGNFSVTGVEFETDGPGGLYDASNTDAAGLDATVMATNYGDLQFAADEEGFAFRRVGRFPVALSDLDGNQRTIIVERTDGVFAEDQAKTFEYELVGEDDVAQVSLQASGSGSVTFSPDTEDEETSSIEAWTVESGTGTLEYSETIPEDQSRGHWVFAPVRSGDGKEMALVDFRHIDGSTESVLGFFLTELKPVEVAEEQAPLQ